MVFTVVLTALHVSSSRQFFGGQRKPHVVSFKCFNISASSKCDEHTRALLVICVLKENTHYTFVLAYSSFNKTYFGKHSYILNWLSQLTNHEGVFMSE